MTQIKLPAFRFGVLLMLHTVLCWRVGLANDVFTDDHGHCTRETPFQLTASDEHFRVRSVTLGKNFETLDCRLPFQAQEGARVCLTFDEFFIDDCGVSLLIYNGFSTHKDQLWKQFVCHDSKPSEICSTGREVTLRLVKENHNQNTGYGLDISIGESIAESVSVTRMIFSSTGFVILFIIAVIVVLTLVALLLYCCCCTSPVMAATPFPSNTKPHYESHSLPSADRPWQ